MDGARLSASRHSHFSSRQTRLLQLGRFVGRCASAAVGISSQGVTASQSSPLKPIDIQLALLERRVSPTSWLAPVAAEAELSENPAEHPPEQVLEAVSRPAIRRQKSGSNSDRCPDPLHARHTRGSPE